jgi:hypothetical protein
VTKNLTKKNMKNFIIATLPVFFVVLISSNIYAMQELEIKNDNQIEINLREFIYDQNENISNLKKEKIIKKREILIAELNQSKNKLALIQKEKFRKIQLAKKELAKINNQTFYAEKYVAKEKTNFDLKIKNLEKLILENNKKKIAKEIIPVKKTRVTKAS